MQKRHLFLAAACALLLALPGVAQEMDGNIANVVFFRAKPGMREQLVAGIKAHMAWHKAQNGTWNWMVWSYETGEFTGGYGAGTFGHNWADFDNPDLDEAADLADAQKNIFPYVAEGAQWRFYELLADVSKPAPPGTAKLSEVVVYHPRQGKGTEFRLLIKKFHQAIQKTNWPVHYEWYALENGGPAGEYVLVVPHDNYADMKGPDKPFRAMLTEAVGAQEAQMMIEHFSKIIKDEQTELIHMRPDLSYQPQPGM
jgi:hypothetical protein